MNSIVYDLQQGTYDLEVRTTPECPVTTKMMKLPFVAQDKTVSGFLVRSLNGNLNVMAIREAEEPKKTDDAKPKFKVVFNSNEAGVQKLVFRPEGIEPEAVNDEHYIEAETTVNYEGVSVTPYGQIEPGSYDLYWKNEKISTIHMAQGGVHTFVVDSTGEEPRVMDNLLTKENSVHILWLIPQFFVITVGEIMISITALEFSYSQAPESMKSVLQACNLLTVAFGNLIVIIVAESKAFDQASEFFMFGCLMLVDMALLAYLAYNYKYVNINGSKNEDSVDSNENIAMEEKPSKSDS